VATLPLPVPEHEPCLPAPAASEPEPRTRRGKGLTPQQRVLRSRLAAYQLHATHDPKETTKKAREAFAARFEREVDPDGLLSPDERARRADAARRAYFTRLALRSSRAAPSRLTRPRRAHVEGVQAGREWPVERFVEALTPGPGRACL